MDRVLLQILIQFELGLHGDDVLGVANFAVMCRLEVLLKLVQLHPQLLPLFFYLLKSLESLLLSLKVKFLKEFFQLLLLTEASCRVSFTHELIEGLLGVLFFCTILFLLLLYCFQLVFLPLFFDWFGADDIWGWAVAAGAVAWHATASWVGTRGSGAGRSRLWLLFDDGLLETLVVHVQISHGFFLLTGWDSIKFALEGIVIHFELILNPLFLISQIRYTLRHKLSTW